MAQQTQIGRVDEAWVGFMDRYPTPNALAEASTAEVLRAWGVRELDEINAHASFLNEADELALNLVGYPQAEVPPRIIGRILAADLILDREPILDPAPYAWTAARG